MKLDIKKIDLNTINNFDVKKDFYSCCDSETFLNTIKTPRKYPVTGKQGIIFETTSKEDCDTGKIDMIVKLSNTFDYLSIHEHLVMEGLGKISSFTPHFVRNLNTFLVQVKNDFRGDDNPFDVSSTSPKQTVCSDILVIEKINCIMKLSELIGKVENKVVYSIITQTLCALYIAQVLKKFTHYDLHSDNILIKGCYANIVFVYIVKDHLFFTPTNGFYPVIIDFGFSHIDDVEDNYCWCDLSQTDIGHTSHIFDPFADIKLFLTTISNEVKWETSSKKLRDYVRDLFRCYKMDKNSGWDVGTGKDLITRSMQYTEDVFETSKLFSSYGYLCLDIISSLIILPFTDDEEFNWEYLEDATQEFMKEFIKIEYRIGNEYKLLYILKGIVDFAR